MANSKVYLNVPFAEKDAAKALGAKWDAIKKSWYVPAKGDLSLFSRWHTQTGNSFSASASRIATSVTDSTLDATTYPKDKNFVAYDGDEPPWL